MTGAELLFEIGCEEIPAGFLARALVDLQAIAREKLAAARLEHGAIATLGAPRRIALSVRELADRQRDVSETVTGPPASAAFDKEGKPTRAALGFAQKQGVDPAALAVVEVPGKGAYVAAKREQRGEPTRSLLPRLLAEMARAIPWKKSMRWASFDEPFVRPVHWIVALYAGEPIPLEIYGAKSGRETRGHRFLAPSPIALDGTLEDYRAKLRRAFVIVDPAARRTEIEAELARVGVRVRRDDALLDEVVNLVEYPRAVVGSFDEKYLAIPPEVVVSAMRAHQRYFATETEGGALARHFVTIAGTITKDPDAVRAGNERVLAARLADAAFFHHADLATSLEGHAKKLDGVVFQAKLGTIGEKVGRLAAWAPLFAAQVPEEKLRLGAALCKADLVTRMVGEFPDLQGVMGRHYALAQGVDADVADAILEHYLPRGAGDKLPRGALGAALGIADRLDTIAGCWAIGLGPTGSADAFGLRRAAIAVLNLLLDRGWPIGLARLVDTAAATYGAKLAWTDELRAQVLEFLKTRFRGLLVEQRQLAADCVDAALAVGFDDVTDALARATAVARLRDRPDFEPLGVAFKRVANILKGSAGGAPSGSARGGGGEGSQPPGCDEPDAARFAHATERALWQAFLAVRDAVADKVSSHDYDAALRELTTLKPAVDKFFDDVLVMDPDLAVRQNRLNLLGTINATFLGICDFRQLAVKS